MAMPHPTLCAPVYNFQRAITRALSSSTHTTYGELLAKAPSSKASCGTTYDQNRSSMERGPLQRAHLDFLRMQAAPSTWFHCHQRLICSDCDKIFLYSKDLRRHQSAYCVSIEGVPKRTHSCAFPENPIPKEIIFGGRHQRMSGHVSS